jgi:uncharacterized protein (TIGR02266 family)
MSERGASEGKPVEAERRESLRVPIRLMVREVALGGSFDEHMGNVSLGGVYFTRPHPPFGTRVEVRFIVPGENVEVHAEGEILEVSREAAGYGAHVRFQELPLEHELAIARFLEKGLPPG